MMKSLFALVVLLHLCSSLKASKELNDEMITRLNYLKELHRDNKLNFTSEKMRMPSPWMCKNPKSCVDVFAKQLNSLLDNVTVHEEKEHIVQELKGNLDGLKGGETDSKCQMILHSDPMTVFGMYVRFLRNLNAKKR